MKIAISGAGIAGPTLAYWLVRSGHDPVLIETAPQLRTGGYLVDFWGAGYTVAERMGLAPTTVKRFAAMSNGCDPSSKAGSGRPERSPQLSPRKPHSDCGCAIESAGCWTSARLRTGRSDGNSATTSRYRSLRCR
ncbi:hypothetical protein FZI85_11465 [Mycobacterium sp. CBMA293]|nr:hypothetical protein [Mycolicibacterium sp. CBMA 360]MUL59153.1 hypothetical protein [Mycolicibacterium sp. CBMA 335]MUL69547.1 hypothetical protein [Mycolicibacterium sp. CBMA 311]MUL94511.1 hypothetical protein [Mycolicibacterium sp. CBMA 230]MUM11640.1 hypothetical protein [Mycolicibacterium sp. CBMA 293]